MNTISMNDETCPLCGNMTEHKPACPYAPKRPALQSLRSSPSYACVSCGNATGHVRGCASDPRYIGA